MQYGLSQAPVCFLLPLYSLSPPGQPWHGYVPRMAQVKEFAPEMLGDKGTSATEDLRLSSKGTADDEDDVGYVYLRRPRCAWCPTICFSCCFRKAKLTNAVLAIAKRGRDYDVESDSGYGSDSDSDLTEADAASDKEGSENGDDNDDGPHEHSKSPETKRLLSASALTSKEERKELASQALLKSRSKANGALPNYGSLADVEEMMELSTVMEHSPKPPEGGETETDLVAEQSVNTKKQRRSKRRKPERKDATQVFKLVFLCAITAFGGVFNNLTFVKMGIAMPGYPAFLLYFTTLLYVIIYFAWLWLRRRSKFAAAAAARAELAAHGLLSDNGTVATVLPREKRSQTFVKRFKELRLAVESEPKDWLDGMRGDLGSIYWVTGILITFGGACSQFSDPHVSGSLQAIINQLTLPLTALCIRFLLKHKFTIVEIVGASIVFIGSLLPIFPVMAEANLEISQFGTSINAPFWVFVFLLSDIPSALVNVLEEMAFSKYKADEIHYLAFTNLLTLFGYFATIPLDRINPGQDSTLAQQSSWKIQEYAFACFFGQEVTYTPFGSTQPITGLPPACEPGAWLPVTGFVICVVIYFYISAVVVKSESAAFQALASTLVTPLSAIAFSSVWIMGPHAKPLDVWTILAIFIVPVGIVIYKWEDVAGEGREDIIPLIARH